MTDSKSWLWRKKSSEKAMMAEKEELALRKHEEEMQKLLDEKAKLERDVRELDGKLSSALSECTVKDDLVKKHSKTGKEALAGWEKAEAKSLSLKQELDEAVKQRDASEDRARQLDSALKECMQQLRFVREDQEQRIHDVLTKSSEELEETKMFFEEKLEESAENIAKLSVENSQLGKILSLKEQLIDDLNQQIAKAEADMNFLLARLENVEKDNNTLRYEVRVLEKEVDIRNEEKEFNRRTADATQKQHMENVKKIAKLESECQRLRVLVQKKLPGPADVAKMKNEVGLLNYKRKSNLNASQFDITVDNSKLSPSKKVNLLSDRVSALEEENSFLQESLQKHLNELQISRNMYLQTATKLSKVEAQLEEFPKHHMVKDVRNIRISHDLSMTSMSSDVGSDDKSVSMSDINHFMDDFAEMEKLALVNSVSGSTGKEFVPVSGVKKVLSSKLSTSLTKLIEIIQRINLTSEDHDLSSTLHNFHGTCVELLNGKADFDTFAQELVSTFEWIMRDSIAKQVGSEETKRKSTIESLRSQLEEQESIVTSLRVELEGLKKSKAEMEDLFEDNVMMIEDLSVQLLTLKCEIKEAHQSFTVLEGELISKATQCEELDAKCLDLQVQLESVMKTDNTRHSQQDKKKLETEWEISAASEKIAECQETILNLGKQLKAMATSRDIVVSDKFMSTPTDTNKAPHLKTQRPSLFERLQSDDEPGLDRLDQSPETKEIISAKDYISANESLAIVPFKKQQITTSSGLFKKLLWRKKRSSSRRMQLQIAG